VLQTWSESILMVLVLVVLVLMVRWSELNEHRVQGHSPLPLLCYCNYTSLFNPSPIHRGIPCDSHAHTHTHTHTN